MATAALRAPSEVGTPMAGRTARWTVRVVLVLAALVGLAARGLALADKRVLSYDESISYLAAACQQGSYGRITRDGRPPVATWVRAADWRRFLEPQHVLCLRRIGSDLASWDIHPPAYFWLLHFWALLTGVGPLAGSLLNLVFVLAGIGALFGLARRVLGSSLPAAFVALLWAASPVVVPVVTEARQYDLFALVTILFVWQVLRVVDVPSQRRAAVLALLTAFGALTHFDFAVVAAGAVVALAPLAIRGARRAALTVLAAVVAGAVASVALNPRFLESYARQREQLGEPLFSDVGGRLATTGRTLAAFLVPAGVLPDALAGVLAVALVAGAVVLALTGWRRERIVLVMLGCVLGGIAVMYVIGMSHPFAMSGKHLAPVWPLLAFVPVLAVLRLPMRARQGTAVGGAVALVVAALVAGERAFPDHDDSAVTTAVRGADAVIVDSVLRGELPPIVYSLPPGTPVYAADGASLRRRIREWAPRLGPHALLVGSPSPDPAVRAERDALLRDLAGTYRARVVATPWYGLVAGEYILLDRINEPAG